MNIRFAYWMPVGIAGYAISKISQRTEWSFDYNKRLAQTAEEVGFNYGLTPARLVASHGWEYQKEAVTITAAMASVTKKLKLIGPVNTDSWHPEVFAKMGAKIDVLSGGRFAINILSGWFNDEYRIFGEPRLAHDECHRRSGEFIQVLKGMWTQDSFQFRGDFFWSNRGQLKPKPLSQPHPEIFYGGNSLAARRIAAHWCDWYLINGNSFEAVKEQILEVSALAREHKRQVKFALNAFVSLQYPQASAGSELEQTNAVADVKAVNGLLKQVKYAGASTSDRIDMWASSDTANVVGPENGFKSRLIGTAQQLAQSIREYYEVGVDMIVCGFLDYTDDLPAFGRTVIPLVRKIEARHRVPILVA